MKLIRGRVLLQVFVIVLATLVLGAAVAGAIIDASEPTLDDLGPLWLINVLPGVLGGLVLGGLLRPTRRQVVPYLVVAAALESLVLLILLAIAQSRYDGVLQANPSALVLGLLQTLGCLVLVAGGLWWWRSRPRTAAADPATQQPDPQCTPQGATPRAADEPRRRTAGRPGSGRSGSAATPPAR